MGKKCDMVKFDGIVFNYNLQLYVATNFLISLKEIILGPKFLNRTDVIPYLQEQVDVMCQKLDMNVPKITLSDIALM